MKSERRIIENRKVLSLLGIHLGDFCGKELIHTLIHPSHEAILLPILRWSTVDLLKEEVEECDNMSGTSGEQPICFLSIWCIVHSCFNHFCFAIKLKYSSSGDNQSLKTVLPQPIKFDSRVLCWNAVSCSGGVVVW